MIIFTVFSFLCGQATNIWMLVACRFFQGMGGGALLSVSASIVYELFPKEKQNVASALFGVGIFVGPTIGPTLGGFITENYSWPWIFYINVPIGIAVALICSRLLGEPPYKPAAGRIDYAGIGLLAVGVGSLQTVLERGETDDWFSANYIVILTVVAALCLSLFIYWELKVKSPVVNLRVLKSKNLSIAALLTFVSGIGLFSSVYLTPVYAQRLLGFAIITVPLSTLAISGLEPKDMPQGRALNNMMRQLGGSFGIAMVNTYLTRRGAVHRTDLVSHINPGDAQVASRLSNYTQYFVGKGATLADAQHQALGLLDATVNRQSSALSFGDTYLLLGAIFLGSLPFLLLARKRKGAKPQVALADH